MSKRRGIPSSEGQPKTDSPPLLPRKPKKKSRGIFPWRRLLRFAFAAAILVSGIAIIAVAVLNFSVKIVLPHFLAARLNAEVMINGVGFGLKPGSIRIKGLEIRGTGMPDFSCDRIDIIPDPVGIARGILALRMISLNQPRLILPPSLPPLSFLLSLNAANPRLPYIFRNISIHDGLIISAGPGPKSGNSGRRRDFNRPLTNPSIPREHSVFQRAVKRIEKINLTLPLFSNTRTTADNDNREWLTPTFAATINSTPVNFKGRSIILSDGIEARLRLRLPHLDLVRHLTSLPMLPGTKISGGIADLDFDTVFRIRRGHAATMSLNGGGRIKGLALEGAEGRTDIPGVRFRGIFSPLTRSYNFSEIIINRPQVTLTRARIKQFLLHPATPPVRIGTLLVNQGKLATGDGELSFTGIDLSLISYPGHGLNPAPFAATAILNRHTTIRIKGAIPTAGGLTAELECQGLDLADIPALPGRLILKRGRARSISATIINAAGTTPGLAITAAAINGLELTTPAGSTLIFPAMRIIRSGNPPGAGEIVLGDISAPAFSLDLADYEITTFTAAEGLTFHNIDLAGGKLALRQHPDLGTWNRVQIRANGPDASGPARINISATAGDGGTIHISGETKKLLAKKGTFACEVKKLPLSILAAVTTKLFPRVPEAGHFSAIGSVSLSPPGFTGRAEIRDIRIGDPASSTSLTIKDLNLTDFRLTAAPAALWIKNGSVSGAAMRIRESEGKKSGRRPWRAQNNNRPTVKIDRLRLGTSRLLLEDRSPAPPLNLALEVERGEISNLGAMTAIDLSGRTAISAGPLSGNSGATHIRLTGIRNNGEDEFNISFALKDLDLAPVSPWLCRLAAFSLRSGEGDWQGKISLRRGQLVADTQMTLRDLDPVSDPDCRFDLKFALALLTDPAGDINIDFPFSANVNHDGFRLYPLVGKKIRTLLLRSSVVPFSTLVDDRGRIPDEFIRFASMDNTISPEAAKNLVLIADALNRRPGLGIRLSGSGPLMEVTLTDGQGRATKTRTVDLGRERGLRVMQFLRNRGINDSRLRLKESDADIDEEVLDRPGDRVDLNLFALKTTPHDPPIQAITDAHPPP